jgi:trimethylamine---corrinoid protein Co-methyltransferase
VAVNSRLNTQILSKENVETIYSKCLKFLSDKGVKVEHADALKIIDQAGAMVDHKNQIVRFPVDLIESALSTVPKKFLFGDVMIPHPENSFYAMTTAGAVYYNNPESGAIDYATLADLQNLLQLQELLDDISITSYPMPNDVPKGSQEVHGVRAALGSTTKILSLMPNTVLQTEHLFELLRIITDEEALRKKSSLLVIQSLLSPFTYKELDAEVMIQSCRSGYPLLTCTSSIAGASAPFTIAGHVLVTAIELLSSLVMTQLIKTGSPVIASLALGRMDMAKGNCFIGVEHVLTHAALAQFIRDAFQVPVHVDGFSQNPMIADEQGATEKALLSLSIALSGANVLGSAGDRAISLGLSPIQLIADDALTRMLKRITAGVEVNEDTLAWQEILSVPPGGDFLRLGHTLKHVKDDTRIDLFRNISLETDQVSDIQPFQQRAIERYHELKPNMKPIELPDEVSRELDKIVRKADEQVLEG